MSNEAITDRGPRPRLQRHVAAAADALLAKGTSVAPVDVLMGIGWLPASVVDAWRRGRAECLDQLAPVSPDKLGAALQHLRRWAAGTGLVPSEVTYLAATHDRRALRFTADGDQATERAWRTLDAIRPDGGGPPARDQGAVPGIRQRLVQKISDITAALSRSSTDRS
jgi:hypothetical protein